MLQHADVQEHQADLDSLADAKSEAQKADEDSAMLAAEVVQMQMEVAAKQARSSPSPASSRQHSVQS